MSEPFKKNIDYLEEKYRDLLDECFEISVWDGWSPLIEEILEKIKKDHPTFKIKQIKEKMGGLRFYVVQFSSDLEEFIRIRERKSFEVCIFTGEKGKPRTIPGQHWVLTVSDNFYEEAKEAGGYALLLEKKKTEVPIESKGQEISFKLPKWKWKPGKGPLDWIVKKIRGTE